jgi:hypothetical protein
MFGLTRSEALLICDALTARHRPSYLAGVRPFDYLVADVEGALRVFELDRKWGTDAATVLSKIRALNAVQRRVLVEAVDRFWELTNLAADAALKKSGLL